MGNETEYEQLRPVLETKCAEMRNADQASITPGDLWAYCQERLWKTAGERPLALHEKVQHIFSIRLSDYIDFRQLEGIQRDAWFTDDASDEWEALLQPAKRVQKRFDTK